MWAGWGGVEGAGTEVGRKWRSVWTRGEEVLSPHFQLGGYWISCGSARWKRVGVCSRPLTVPTHGIALLPGIDMALSLTCRRAIPWVLVPTRMTALLLMCHAHNWCWYQCHHRPFVSGVASVTQAFQPSLPHTTPFTLPGNLMKQLHRMSRQTIITSTQSGSYTFRNAHPVIVIGALLTLG